MPNEQEVREDYKKAIKQLTDLSQSRIKFLDLTFAKLNTNGLQLFFLSGLHYSIIKDENIGKLLRKEIMAIPIQTLEIIKIVYYIYFLQDDESLLDFTIDRVEKPNIIQRLLEKIPLPEKEKELQAYMEIISKTYEKLAREAHAWFHKLCEKHSNKVVKEAINETLVDILTDCMSFINEYLELSKTQEKQAPSLVS